MGVTRLLDLLVILLLAAVVLMPRPDASVKPALSLDAERRAREEAEAGRAEVAAS